jgi:hypothetical protein
MEVAGVDSRLQSEVVLEWQREAEIERSRRAILRVLNLRHHQKTPTDLATTVKALNDLEELSRWFDLEVTTDSLEACRIALAAAQSVTTNSSGNGF